MEYAVNDDVFSLTEPSTPSTFYTSGSGGLSLTNTIEEDEDDQVISGFYTTPPRTSYSHSREDIITGAIPRNRNTSVPHRLPRVSLDKRKASPYSSISPPGEAKKKRSDPMVSLASIMDPEAGKFEASMKTCQKYLEHCKRHLPNILSTVEYESLIHRIAVKSAGKYSNYLASLRDSLSEEKRQALVEILNNSVHTDEEGIMSIGDPGLDPKQSIHIIPDLATREKRLTIPRQDGKPGPGNDPEEHWGHDYWEEVVSRKKLEEKDIVATFVRLVSGRMDKEMNELVDNSEQVQIDKDLEAQRREQKAALKTLTIRLQSLLSQYEKATETEVSIMTTQLAIGSRTVVGEQAREILEEYDKLSPGIISVRDIVLLEKLRGTGVILQELHQMVFSSVQDVLGASLSNPKDASVSYDSVQRWLKAIIEELIVMSLGQSPGFGIQPPSVLRVDPTSETPTSGVVEFPDLGYSIDTKDILDTMTLPFQVLINNVKRGLRYVTELNSNYAIGNEIAEYLSEYEDAARKILIDELPDRGDLDEYIRLIKLSIYVVYGVFLNNAKLEIREKLPNVDKSDFSSSMALFIEQISDEIALIENIEGILENGEKILFGRPEASRSSIKSGLKVYNELTAPANAYVFIEEEEEFHIPEKPFEQVLLDLIERSISLFEQFGPSIDIIAIKHTVDTIKSEEDDETRLKKLYRQLTLLFPRLESLIYLQPRETEREQLQTSIMDITARMEVLSTAMNDVLDRIARIRPVYRHTAQHAAQIQHSGIVIPSPTLEFANTKAFSIITEKLPDVARAGIAKLQSDTEVVAHYVDLVSGIILESRTDFGRQWTQKERMEKAIKIQADGFLGLAKHTWSGKHWLYGEDILSRRKHTPPVSTRRGGLGLSFPMPMLTIVRPEGPGFY